MKNLATHGVKEKYKINYLNHHRENKMKIEWIVRVEREKKEK